MHLDWVLLVSVKTMVTRGGRDEDLHRIFFLKHRFCGNIKSKSELRLSWMKSNNNVYPHISFNLFHVMEFLDLGSYTLT